jgi:2-polyprenyl-3-methyl-5-hydroxy-6-metoxy-1,4-benzoquinol methylase
VNWFENEEFWSVLAPIIMFGPHSANRAAAEASAIACHLGAAARVLDLGCGLGYHALQLAASGHRVTAVDRCSQYLDTIRRTAKERSLALDLVEADMRAYCEPDAFDAAINLGTTFGFFENVADDFRVISNLHKSLRPDGLLIMDMVGKEIISREFAPKAEYSAGEHRVTVVRKASDDWSWIEESWTLDRPNATRNFPMCYRPYSGPELVHALTAQGFREVRISGDLLGCSLYPFGRRLVAFARK